MSENLSAFFAQNVVSEQMEDFIVSERFKDKDGKSIAWKLRSMTEEENEQCRKSATKREKKGGKYITETNPEEYIAKLVTASVLFPVLKDAALQKSYGVMGETALLKKMLLPGEYAALSMKVQEINGFDRDTNELIEEVKN